MNMEVLKGKMKAHQDLANSMEDHCKELENLLQLIKEVQYKQAALIYKSYLDSLQQWSDIKASGASFENIKILNDGLIRIDKDFAYLMHPSKLPRAYEKTIIEIARRRKFRRLIDEEYHRVKKAVKKEQESR